MAAHPPDFVVAGAARAGTTAVVESLRSHPDAFVTEPKEPHYLAYAGQHPTFTGPGDDVTINRVAVTDRDAYLGLFSSAAPRMVVGEGSVSTLYQHTNALPRLRELNPQVRVVLVLRDPVERAFSSFQYLRNRGFEPEPDFLTALAREPERQRAGWHHLWHYTGMSMYAEPVWHTLATFGRDQVLVCWYDDLVAHTHETLDRIHAFIGVDASRRARADPDRVNASGTPRYAWVQTAMHRASRSPRVRQAIKAAVPFSVRERIRNANLASHSLPPATRAVLTPWFAQDLDALEDVLACSVPPAWRR